MARRSTSPVVATMVGFALAACWLPASAHAQGQLTDTFYFSHDDTKETQSSLFSSIPYDAEAQPDSQRLEFPQFLDAFDSNSNYTVPPVDELREVFRFEVDPSEENGSFRAQLNWANPTIDFDMYIYRERPNGTLDPAPVAQSATANDEEVATYISPTIDSPVEPDPYVIYVDNWCSSEEDPTVDETLEFLGDDPDVDEYCGVDDPGIDEDDFSGKVEFSPLVKMNKLPSANLSGPGEAPDDSRVTFTGSGADLDGDIVEYNFDLDGDGLFEYTATPANPSVTKVFDEPGSYSIGLRVIDDRGGVGYDSRSLTVKPTSGSQGTTTTPTPPANPGATKPVAADDTLYSYKLSAPVFGGRKGVALVARYRLRKAARVELTLYRGTGKKLKRVKRLTARSAAAGKPYRVEISPRRRARGLYTVRLLVRPTDGSARKIYKLISRRL